MVCRSPFRCAGRLVSGTHLGGQHIHRGKPSIQARLAGGAAGDHLRGRGVSYTSAIGLDLIGAAQLRAIPVYLPAVTLLVFGVAHTCFGVKSSQ